MSAEVSTTFADALRTDEGLARGLITAIGQKQGADAVRAFAAYAQKQGFAAPKQDTAAFEKAAGNSEGTLWDEELEGLAGGSYSRLLGRL